MAPPPRLVAAPEPGGSADPLDEEQLADALRGGRAWAEREALERFTPHVRRVLARILGATSELDDLTQEVFLRGLDRIEALRDGVALRIWFDSFAVNVAREALRARTRRRWLLFFKPDEVPEVGDESAFGDAKTDATLDARRALKATYEILNDMRTELRMAFALRHLEGMELRKAAQLCGVSLATVKRRVRAAEVAFLQRARGYPVLHLWLEEGGRWT